MKGQEGCFICLHDFGIVLQLERASPLVRADSERQEEPSRLAAAGNAAVGYMACSSCKCMQVSPCALRICHLRDGACYISLLDFFCYATARFHIVMSRMTETCQVHRILKGELICYFVQGSMSHLQGRFISLTLHSR